MLIDGVTVLIEKGRWVKEDLLFRNDLFPLVLDKLSLLIREPDYGRFSQAGRFRKIKRIELHDGLRLYLKLYPTARILTILAAVSLSQVKHGEGAGSIDPSLFAFLKKHDEEFLAERFVDFQLPKPKEKLAPALEEKPLSRIRVLTEEEAIRLLDATRPEKGRGSTFHLDPFCEDAAKKVESSGGYRVIVDLPAGVQLWEREKIMTLQRAITKTLTFFGLSGSVRYDDISQKILVVPKDKIDVYCFGSRGKRPQLAA